MIALIGCILAGMVVEGAGLLVYHRRTGRGLSPGALLPNLFAGAMLMLAVGVLVGGAAWWWVLPCLAGALVGHLADLRGRWRH